MALFALIVSCIIVLVYRILKTRFFSFRSSSSMPFSPSVDDGSYAYSGYACFQPCVVDDPSRPPVCYDLVGPCPGSPAPFIDVDGRLWSSSSLAAKAIPVHRNQFDPRHGVGPASFQACDIANVRTQLALSPFPVLTSIIENSDTFIPAHEADGDIHTCNHMPTSFKHEDASCSDVVLHTAVVGVSHSDNSTGQFVLDAVSKPSNTNHCMQLDAAASPENQKQLKH